MGISDIPRFLAKTVMIENNNVSQGMGVLNRIMSKEGLYSFYRRNLYYEKPHKLRRRINKEKIEAIVKEDVELKLKLALRTNRKSMFFGRC